MFCPSPNFYNSVTSKPILKHLVTVTCKKGVKLQKWCPLERVDCVLNSVFCILYSEAIHIIGHCISSTQSWQNLSLQLSIKRMKVASGNDKQALQELDPNFMSHEEDGEDLAGTWIVRSPP